MAARTEAETNVNLGPKWIWLRDDVTFKETHLKQPKTIIKKTDKKQTAVPSSKCVSFLFLWRLTSYLFP